MATLGANPMASTQGAPTHAEAQSKSQTSFAARSMLSARTSRCSRVSPSTPSGACDSSSTSLSRFRLDHWSRRSRSAGGPSTSWRQPLIDRAKASLALPSNRGGKQAKGSVHPRVGPGRPPLGQARRRATASVDACPLCPGIPGAPSRTPRGRTSRAGEGRPHRPASRPRSAPRGGASPEYRDSGLAPLPLRSSGPRQPCESGRQFPARSRPPGIPPSLQCCPTSLPAPSGPRQARPTTQVARLQPAA